MNVYLGVVPSSIGFMEMPLDSHESQTNFVDRIHCLVRRNSCLDE